MAKRGERSEEVGVVNRDSLSGNVARGSPRVPEESTGAVGTRAGGVAMDAGSVWAARPRAVEAHRAALKELQVAATGNPKHSIRCGNIWECGVGSSRPPSAGASASNRTMSAEVVGD